jgi:Ras-related protein Rab-24
LQLTGKIRAAPAPIGHIQMRDSAQDLRHSIKVILIGSRGVGKTSLLATYFDSPFEQNVLPTVAPAFSPMVVTLSSGLSINLQIWDTAGQERYQSISQMFYRGAQVALVCFDRDTTDTIHHWVAQLRNVAFECLVFLVTTKIDLLSQEQITECQAQGAQKIAEVAAHQHVMTSARTGQGVKELFTAVAECWQAIGQNPVTETGLQSGGQKKCC